ncbi:hypothetical protein O2K51_05970 [Apibacter raozihei]|uniref:HU domain-containing protein n=1 Tax=Apibacter TaxID=1778601 RepID=UPI000FE3B8AB|nr:MULTISPECIES: hypothetical protein [Apibacter]
MELLKYCIQLLEDNKQITLPTLGKFNLLFESAKVDPESKKTFPPRYALVFSQQHSLNDNTLAKEISLAESKDFKLVKESVDKTINEWKEILKSNGKLDLDKLGTFSSDKEKIIFSMSENCIFNYKYFGLPAIQ